MSRFMRLVISLFVLLACTALTAVFQSTLAHCIILLFILSVLFSSLYAGTIAGLCTAILSVGIASYFFMDPPHSFKVDSVSDLLQLIVLIAVAVVVGMLKSQKDEAEYWLKVHDEGRKAKLNLS